MNPWITGRIIETMQHDYRARGDEARLGRAATSPRRAAHEQAHARNTESPRRERFGLAIARVGLRIAGRRTTPAPNLDASHWSNPWTTCGATSTPPR
ncbi:MAG: hypothetical protein ACXVJW_16670 [Acidimicrobiia bacterium]